MSWLKRRLRALYEHAEDGVERVFGPEWNPMRQLGALGWLLFWIIAGSGLYLYIFFDTGVTQAYESIRSLTYEQWWAGGIMRSLHRYASDALVAVAIVHMLREFAFDRLRGPRWFAWITGLVVLGFVYVCGITGYWMVWDRLAQYVAVTTSELLDRLPLFVEPIARNFLGDLYLSGRFFTLMVYVHIAAPLLMLLFMWVHIMRYAEAKVTPARGLSWSTAGMLLALSLIWPAVSQPPADLGHVPTVLGLDWFYLPLYPVIDRWGVTAVWLAALATSIVLVLLPWVGRRRRAGIAVVHLDNCNGCGRCVEDCPFSAITLEPRSDGAPFAQQVLVNAAHCVACGICAGACPTATPFRRATALVPGIELPDDPLSRLREEILARGAKLEGTQRVVVLTCQHGATVPESPSVAVIQTPCVGMVPPPFIDFVLARKIADGVLLAGCRERECYHRLGYEWTEQRIAAKRDPNLRERVSRDRVGVSWAAPTQSALRRAELELFQRELAGGSPAPRSGLNPWRRARLHGGVAWRTLGQALAYSCAAALLAYFSIAPRHEVLGPKLAMVNLSFSQAGRLKEPCTALTPAELAKLPINMRRPRDCRRERWPIEVQLVINGELMLSGRYAPAGLWSDGPSTVYKRFAVPAGQTTLSVRLRDSGRVEGFDYTRSATVDLETAQNLVIDFHAEQGGFSIH
jgi:ferredoxin/coenzyme F420-reducing hydrogenase delta subunit